MKSTLFNMVAVLFSITLIASAGVGAVNMITADAIAEAKAIATKQAIANVLPEFDSSEQSEQTIDDMPIKVHTATKGDDVVGYAVESMTKDGFGGVILDELIWDNFDSCRSTDYTELVDRFKRVKKVVDKL